MLSTTLKPKTCTHCGTKFMPARLMQSVCSPICAARKVKAAKVEERAQIRTRKEAAKPRGKLTLEAQQAFNAWIRARDEHQPCISCGKPPGDMTQLHAGRDAGHYRSVGAAKHLRFHEDNCHAQCVRCNQWDAGKAVDYRIGLVARIGVERVEAIEHDNTVRKYTDDDLRAIRDKYRAKARQMKKERA